MEKPGESGESNFPSLPVGARLLVIRLRSIGDIVLLTPALRLVKAWRPDLHLSILVESQFRELLEGNTDADEVLGVESARASPKRSAYWRIAESLWRGKFDVSINLHGGPTSAWLTAASRARWRVGFAHFHKSWLYNVRIPDARGTLMKEKIHTAEHQACAFFRLGMPKADIPRARLIVSARSAEWWAKATESIGIETGRDYAVLHSPALYATKQWAPDRFAKLGHWLEREARVIPVYSAGPGEAAVLDAVERAANAPIRRLPPASLGQFSAAIAGARLFIGNDSGPAHMAAALGRPLVVIFGSSSSDIWGPWPRESVGASARVVQNEYPCNPCRGDRCYQFERPECILSVSETQVQKAVEEILTYGTRPTS